MKELLKALSLIFTLIPAILAGCIAVGILEENNMWAAIVLYWTVVMVNNLLDVLVKAFTSERG